MSVVPNTSIAEAFFAMSHTNVYANIREFAGLENMGSLRDTCSGAWESLRSTVPTPRVVLISTLEANSPHLTESPTLRFVPGCGLVVGERWPLGIDSEYGLITKDFGRTWEPATHSDYWKFRRADHSGRFDLGDRKISFVYNAGRGRGDWSVWMTEHVDWKGECVCEDPPFLSDCDETVDDLTLVLSNGTFYYFGDGRPWGDPATQDRWRCWYSRNAVDWHEMYMPTLGELCVKRSCTVCSDGTIVLMFFDSDAGCWKVYRVHPEF